MFLYLLPGYKKWRNIFLSLFFFRRTKYRHRNAFGEEKRNISSFNPLINLMAKCIDSIVTEIGSKLAKWAKKKRLELAVTYSFLSSSSNKERSKSRGSNTYLQQRNGWVSSIQCANSSSSLCSAVQIGLNIYIPLRMWKPYHATTHGIAEGRQREGC